MPNDPILLIVLAASSVITSAMALMLRAQDPPGVRSDEHDPDHGNDGAVRRYIGNRLFGFSGMMLLLAAAIWLGDQHASLRGVTTAPFAEASIVMTISLIAGIALRAGIKSARRRGERR